jgi:DNA repair exonuclease SbcCD ATPase subunit
MNKPQPAPEDAQSFEQEFSQELASVEEALADLKQRYTGVQQAETEQNELKEQQKVLQSRRLRDSGLKAELKEIQKRLEDLELILESRLLSWSSFKEPFWQIVRFGGLGIVLGWILHSYLNR